VCTVGFLEDRNSYITEYMKSGDAKSVRARNDLMHRHWQDEQEKPRRT
jgi:hypothetical protein